MTKNISYSKNDQNFYAGVNYYPQNFFYPPHFHQEESQLIFVEKGLLTVETEKETWRIPPYTGLWIPKGLTHAFNYLKKTKVSFIFSGHVENEILYQLKFSKCFIFSSTTLIDQLFQKMVMVYKKDSRQIKKMELIFQLLIEEISEAPSLNLSLQWPKDERLSRMIQMLINEEFTRVSLETLSSNTGASLRNLNRICQKECGYSLSEWRDRYRLLKAIELLKSGNGNLESALLVGFDSILGLKKLITKRTGLKINDFK